MRYLLDTHVWLWMLVDPERLGHTRHLLEDPEHDLLLSAASTWEITVKHALGRLTLPDAPERYVPERMRATGVVSLAIEHVHVLGVGSLPPHHRDPFDRVLVAQARYLGVPIVTADAALTAYDVDLVRVGDT
jgi:PIN domain nuclease of toxin-antitoxin system